MISIASSCNNLEKSINIRESVYLTLILLLKSVEISFLLEYQTLFSRVVNIELHFILFYFIFYFILFLVFIFIILDFDKKYNIILYMIEEYTCDRIITYVTVTDHNHMTQKKL